MSIGSFHQTPRGQIVMCKSRMSITNWPISLLSSRFLKYTHMRQAFRSEDESMSDIMQRSILGHILPEAMVCYLENYSEERFAKIFLGLLLLA